MSRSFIAGLAVATLVFVLGYWAGTFSPDPPQGRCLGPVHMDRTAP